MLRQVCRRALLIIASQDTSSESSVQDFFRSLESSRPPSNTVLHEETLAAFLGKGKLVDLPTQHALLRYLEFLGQAWHLSNESPPHTDRNWIIPSRANLPTQIVLDKRTYSCGSSHSGNSAIMFYDPQNVSRRLTGVIETIIQIPLHFTVRTFLIVHLHQDLPAESEALFPFGTYPGLQTKVVETRPSIVSTVIEPRHIITHLTSYKRPPGTYNTTRDTLVICWALNRGRK